MPVTRILSTWLIILGAGMACVPNYMTNYDAEMLLVASCRVEKDVEECLGVDGGTALTGKMTVDERGDATRVFLRQEVLVGSSDGDRLHVKQARESIYRQTSCITRQTLVLDGVLDDPGFGLRRQVTGTVEQSNISDGDPQQCGQNVPFGEIQRYRLRAIEVSQP